jgi:hypothetical protein
MNGEDKDNFIRLIEKITRIDTLITEHIKKDEETLINIKASVKVANEEMGRLDKSMDAIHIELVRIKESSSRSAFYWKLIAFIVSPIVTTVIVIGVQACLHL